MSATSGSASCGRCAGRTAEDRDEIAIPEDLVAAEPGPFEPRLHELPAERFVARGREVFALLLGKDGRERLRALQRRPDRLRLEVEESPDAHEAAAVPWELAHDGRRHLATYNRLELVRRPVDAVHLEEVRWSRPLRMLIFWAEPTAEGVGPIGIAREQIALGLALAGPRNRREIEPVELVHASRERLHEALATWNYDILYFSGHGTVRDGMGYLVLERDGGLDPMSALELENAVARQEPPPALVFLNCCVSGRSDDSGNGSFLDLGRRLLEVGVAHVVATLDPITVRSSREWMESFFRDLVSAERRDVGRAIVAARSALSATPDRTTAQSFYQYMHLTAAEAGVETVIEEEETPLGVGRAFVGASAERPRLEPPVWRNGMQLQAEEAFLAGARVLGLYAPGGLGKTVFTVQLEERLLRHPDGRLRPQNAIWIDLRGDATRASGGAAVGGGLRTSEGEVTAAVAPGHRQARPRRPGASAVRDLRHRCPAHHRQLRGSSRR